VKYKVTVTSQAEREMLDQAFWWADHHSAEQAIVWHDGFQAALESLENQPERHPRCAESKYFSVELRELRYGVSKRPTHRAVFSIGQDEVMVYTIRHLAQQELREGDF
jgi:plasmid stabilization system protein ParE